MIAVSRDAADSEFLRDGPLNLAGSDALWQRPSDLRRHARLAGIAPVGVSARRHPKLDGRRHCIARTRLRVREQQPDLGSRPGGGETGQTQEQRAQQEQYASHTL